MTISEPFILFTQIRVSFRAKALSLLTTGLRILIFSSSYSVCTSSTTFASCPVEFASLDQRLSQSEFPAGETAPHAIPLYSMYVARHRTTRNKGTDGELHLVEAMRSQSYRVGHVETCFATGDWFTEHGQQLQQGLKFSRPTGLRIQSLLAEDFPQTLYTRNIYLLYYRSMRRSMKSVS